MGKRLGVTSTGVENNQVEGSSFTMPREDDVEDYTLVKKLSNVKKLFQEMREKSLQSMQQQRGVSPGGSGPYP